MTSLRSTGKPLPGCAWLVSPWVDLQMTGASMTKKADVDPLIQKPYLEELAAAYLAGTDPADPRVSPLNADLTGLPPLLIQVGSAETLLDDARAHRPAGRRRRRAGQPRDLAAHDSRVASVGGPAGGRPPRDRVGRRLHPRKASLRMH